MNQEPLALPDKAKEPTKKSVIVTLLDGSKIEVKEITFGEWKDTRKESEEFDNEVALIRACTGLSVERIDDLDVPEFNDLKRASIKVNDPQDVPESGATIVNMRDPVFTVYGEKVQAVKINMPKVRVARELAKLTNPTARVEYMIKSTTGIADLDSVWMGDYSLLVLLVPDFFAQGAAYFQKSK